MCLWYSGGVRRFRGRVRRYLTVYIRSLILVKERSGRHRAGLCLAFPVALEIRHLRECVLPCVIRRQESRTQHHRREWPILAENHWPNPGRKLTTWTGPQSHVRRQSHPRRPKTRTTRTSSSVRRPPGAGRDARIPGIQNVPPVVRQEHPPPATKRDFRRIPADHAQLQERDRAAIFGATETAEGLRLGRRNRYSQGR